jgi:hypothetical protein
MRVTVTLQREGGQFRPSYSSGQVCTGDLHLTYRTSQNSRVTVLQLLGAARRFPNLYDPKLVDLSGTTLRFIGYEPVEGAWVMQEWHCELA